MDSRKRSDIKIGKRVLIFKKQDQKTGILTEGKVLKHLTNKSFHPRGIKVMLEDNTVGRVVEVLEGDFVPNINFPDIGKVIEKMLTNTTMLFSKYNKIETRRLYDCNITKSEVDFFLFNNLMSFSFKGDFKSRLNDIVKFIDKDICIWSSKRDTPSNFKEEVEKLGATLLDEAIVMACNIEDLEENNKYDVVEVTNDEMLKKWNEVVIKANELLDTISNDWYNLYKSMEYGKGNLNRHFYITINDKAVGVISLINSNGISSIANLAVLKEYRRRGIGKALTLHAFKEAEKEGYKVGALTASEGGYKLYKTLGFKEIEKINMYLYKKSHK